MGSNTPAAPFTFAQPNHQVDSNAQAHRQDQQPSNPDQADVDTTQHQASQPSTSGRGAAQPQAGNPLDPARPACFVITHNVAKKHNIGTIARCATAFGVKEVCLVGSRQYNTFGSHGADVYVAFRHFDTLNECVRHLKEVEGCEVVGVEIADSARAVQQHPFKGPTAFMLGNEGQGLSPKQMSLCDSFVYIPQYGTGTASLNVAVAASLVLHHFALWAGYAERERQGAKFVVADRPHRTAPRGVVRDSDDAVRLQRQQRRQQLLQESEGAAALGLDDGAFGQGSEEAEHGEKSEEAAHEPV